MSEAMCLLTKPLRLLCRILTIEAVVQGFVVGVCSCAIKAFFLFLFFSMLCGALCT